MNNKSRFVVSPEWLMEHLGEPGLSIIDGSWYLPAQNRDARAEYDSFHIPGAVFFDHDRVVEPGTGLPHSLPSPALFEQFAGAMGITRDDTIVVYDGPGFFSAPRVWWMFKLMGVKEVFLLDGGLDGWKTCGHPVTEEPTATKPCVFSAKFDAAWVANLAGMLSIIADGSSQIADARPAGRFTGKMPEPRQGIRSGHMPGARSVPAQDLSRNGRFLPLDELRQLFERSGIDLDRPVVTTCGSGVTAAVIILALQSLGHVDNKLYDGSWSEWGGRDDTPVVTG